MIAESSEFGSGWQKWNSQAWYDYIVVKLMMSKVGYVIPKTYVPILRLVSEDVGKVDDGYAQVVALREPVRLFDSPREKWRKIYGSYIRELEWVYGELRKHFPTKEYQDLVTDIMARAIREAMGAFLPSLEKMTRTSDTPSTDAQTTARSSRKRAGGRQGGREALQGQRGQVGDGERESDELHGGPSRDGDAARRRNQDVHPALLDAHGARRQSDARSSVRTGLQGRV